MPYVGNPLANAFSSREKQDLTGQSGTSFTLTHSVSHANDLSVYINHVRQEPTTAYTVNGTTLTTTGSVAGTDDFYIIYDELALQSISHPSNQAMTATSGTFTSGLVGTTATFSGALSATTGTFSGAVDIQGQELILDADNDTSITADTDDQIDFKTAGTDRLSIDASGFINHIFTSDNSTTAEGFFINNRQNTTGNNASLILSNDSGARKKAAIAYIDTGNYGAGDLVFALDGADSGELHLTNDEKMRLDSDGNLGLGINASFTSGNGFHLADNYYVGFGNGANSRPDFQLGYDATNTRLAIKMRDDSDNTHAFFTTAGSFEIGTVTTPTGGACSFKNNSGAATMRLQNINGGNAIFQGLNLNGAQSSYITESGVGYFANGVSSDETLKNVKGEMNDGWSKLKDVQPKSFTWKKVDEDGNKSDEDLDGNIHYGVMAQDLKKVIPDLAYGKEGGMSVDYNGLLMVAINTIKELEARIKILESK
nr:hypothetical protein [uncultured Mediterranean phage uvMED]